MTTKRNYHPLFRRWTAIRQHFYNPADKHYQLVQEHKLKCQSLDDFQGFVEFIENEIGELPSPRHKLNRINQKKGWVRGNLRWATAAEVGNNLPHNIRLKYQGRTQTLKEWAIELGVEYSALLSRRIRGWNTEQILTTPLQLKRRNAKT